MKKTNLIVSILAAISFFSCDESTKSNYDANLDPRLSKLKKSLADGDVGLLNSQIKIEEVELLLSFEERILTDGSEITVYATIKNISADSLIAPNISSLDANKDFIMRQNDVKSINIECSYGFMVSRATDMIVLDKNEYKKFRIAEFVLKQDYHANVLFKLFAPKYIENGVYWREINVGELNIVAASRRGS
jgi:hypothetical protein